MDAPTDSQIRQFYAGKNIFLTGGTGFLGKCLIEKILRACPDVGNIYMLCRAKKGKSAIERLNTIFQEQLFEEVRATDNQALKKVIPLIGDVMDPKLGLSEEDEQKITDNVHIMIHSAATIRFDEHIKYALQLNVGGTVKMVELARRAKNLESFIHVSTAYSNCNLLNIDEVWYDMGSSYDPLKFLELSTWMDDDVMASMTKTLLRDRPNTYCLTKALAENYVFKHATDLPIAVFRPSIIGASWREPVPGWIDNYNGPSGLFIAIGKGVLRILEGDVTKVADIIPIDYCVNMMLAIGWYTTIVKPKVETPLIYHCTSGSKQPFTWSQIGTIVLDIFQNKMPLNQVFRRPNVNFANNKLELFYWKIISHYIPAYLADSVFILLGKKTRMLYAYDKIHKASLTFTFFTKRQWTWTSDNCDMLLGQMSDTDKRTFDFDVNHIHWNEYYPNYLEGAKRYLLKEDMSDTKLEEARQQQMRLRNIRYISVSVISLLVSRFLYLKSPVCRNLWFKLLGILMRILRQIRLTIVS